MTTYGYNIANSRTGFLLTQDGTQQMSILYDYDALNRLTGITSGTVTAQYGYDTNGNRSYVEYDSGVREEYTYNLANLLTSLVNENSGSTVLSQYEYTYTLDGNPVSKTDQSGKITAYTYDGLGRLTGESESMAGSTTQSYSYTYDDWNNRATLTAAGVEAYVTAYSYDANNRLLTAVKTGAGCVDTTTYYYDLNGNQIAEVTERVAEETGSESIALTEGVAGSQLSRYNGFNQLVETNADGTEVAYTYYPSGLRASKTVEDVTTEFVLDGGSVVLELVSGSVTAQYVRGINLVYGVIGSDESYYLYNGHGDVVQLVSASETVTQEYDYDAFGNEKDPDETDTNPFRYCGEYYDLSSGTYYLRARYYDPTIGRFLSEDTYTGQATDPLSLNLYTYCKNNPIMCIDPTGHDSYILCSPSAEGTAKVTAMQSEFESYYGTTCHIIYVSSKDEFIDAWNSMGIVDGTEVGIDSVVADFHGWAGGYSFMDEKDNWVSGDQGSIGISDISSLDQKSMKYYISLGCHTGGDADGNPLFVEQLLLSQSGISRAIAPNGFSYGNASTKTTGILWWKKTVTFSQIWVGEGEQGAQGYMVFQRDSNTGEIFSTVIGAPGHIFKGIDSLIKAGNKV